MTMAKKRKEQYNLLPTWLTANFHRYQLRLLMTKQKRRNSSCLLIYLFLKNVIRTQLIPFKSPDIRRATKTCSFWQIYWSLTSNVISLSTGHHLHCKELVIWNWFYFTEKCFHMETGCHLQTYQCLQLDLFLGNVYITIDLKGNSPCNT